MSKPAESDTMSDQIPTAQDYREAAERATDAAAWNGDQQSVVDALRAQVAMLERAFEDGRSDTERIINALRSRAETAERQIAQVRAYCGSPGPITAKDVFHILDAQTSERDR